MKETTRLYIRYSKPLDLGENHDTHVANLNKLADFLDTVPEEHFDMGDFIHTSERHHMSPHRASAALNEVMKPHNDQTPHHPCGTAACALGWAAYLWPQKEGDYVPWEEVSCSLFNVGYHQDEWDFLFSGEWEPVDNSPQFAAQRIRFLIKYGLPKYATEPSTDHLESITDAMTACN